MPSTVATAASEQLPPAPWKSFGLAEDVAVANKRAQTAAPTPTPTSERKPQTPMALPNRNLTPKVDPEQELIDQLLPQPALDFSKAPKHLNDVNPDDPYSIYKPTKAKMEKWILVTLVLVLVGAVGLGVWKLGLIQRFAWHSAKKNAPATQSVAAPTPVPPVTAAAEKEPPPADRSPAGENAASATGTKPPLDETERKAPNAADFHTAGPTPESEIEKTPERQRRSESFSSWEKETVTAKNAKKKSTPSESAETPVEAPVPDDAPVLAPKLLKAVSPVYPPDAMNNFITGDVRLKADLDEKGKIRDVEVISGPAALRPAAIEAMKQYEYAPATKGGRAVASQVNVTIKFWFNP